MSSVHSMVESRRADSDVWAGRRRLVDIDHPELAMVQHIAVQAGQGRIADRDNERLGRSDAGIILWRKILRRELQALANAGGLAITKKKGGPCFSPLSTG